MPREPWSNPEQQVWSILAPVQAAVVAALLDERFEQGIPHQLPVRAVDLRMHGEGLAAKSCPCPPARHSRLVSNAF